MEKDILKSIANSYVAMRQPVEELDEISQSLRRRYLSKSYGHPDYHNTKSQEHQMLAYDFEDSGEDKEAEKQRKKAEKHLRKGKNRKIGRRRAAFKTEELNLEESKRITVHIPHDKPYGKENKDAMAIVKSHGGKHYGTDKSGSYMTISAADSGKIGKSLKSAGHKHDIYEGVQDDDWAVFKGREHVRTIKNPKNNKVPNNWQQSSKESEVIRISKARKMGYKINESIFKEEVENLDELSNDLKKRYIKRAIMNAIANTADAFEGEQGKDKEKKLKKFKKALKRQTGINRAVDTLKKEDTIFDLEEGKKIKFNPKKDIKLGHFKNSEKTHVIAKPNKYGYDVHVHDSETGNSEVVSRGYSLDKHKEILNKPHNASRFKQAGGVNWEHESMKENTEKRTPYTIKSAYRQVVENDRARHYRGATKPAQMGDNLGKTNKDYVDQMIKNTKVDDTEEKGHQDAVKAGQATKQADNRNGTDKFDNGDKKIVKPVSTVTNQKVDGEMKETVGLDDAILSVIRQANIEKHEDAIERLSEDTQLDEISKKTLATYIKSAGRDMAYIGGDIQRSRAQGRDSDPTDLRRYKTRRKGIDKAVDRLAKEEVQTVEESKEEAAKQLAALYKKRAYTNGHGRRARIQTNIDKLHKDHGIKDEWKKHYVKEDVERLSEVSRKTLASYISKRSSDLSNQTYKADRKKEIDSSSDNRIKKGKDIAYRVVGLDGDEEKRIKKYSKGISLAAKKIAAKSEDTEVEGEQLDEISKQTKASYLSKASYNLGYSAAGATHENPALHPSERKKKQQQHIRNYVNRTRGIQRVAKSMAKEDVEPVNELSKKTLSSYLDKAPFSLASAAAKSRDQYSQEKDRDKNFDKAINRIQGIRRAGKSLAAPKKRKKKEKFDPVKAAMKRNGIPVDENTQLDEMMSASPEVKTLSGVIQVAKSINDSNFGDFCKQSGMDCSNYVWRKVKWNGKYNMRGIRKISFPIEYEYQYKSKENEEVNVGDSDGKWYKSQVTITFDLMNGNVVSSDY